MNRSTRTTCTMWRGRKIGRGNEYCWVFCSHLITRTKADFDQVVLRKATLHIAHCTTLVTLTTNPLSYNNNITAIKTFANQVNINYRRNSIWLKKLHLEKCGGRCLKVV